MSTDQKPGKRAIIWEQSFYGNPIIAGLTISDQGRLLAILVRMGAADSPDITDNIIVEAARQCREKPSRLRGTLAKCGAIFDRREDGTLYSSKLVRAIAERERKQNGSAQGSRSGQEPGLKTGSKWGRNADALSSESPSKSRQTEPDFRRPPVQEEEKASTKREVLLGESTHAGTRARPHPVNESTAATQAEDPLAELVKRTAGRASGEDWTKVLGRFQRTPQEVLSLWNRLNGSGSELVDSFGVRTGTALAQAITNHLTSV
ncbi:MAG: hypothetical protein ACSLFQ_13385 [Thermoanaerobaculia bacterium]